MKKQVALLTVALLPGLANAAEGVAGAKPDAAYWAAGLCMGLAAAVVAYSQSRAASAALEGIGRNPASAKPGFVPMILCLALMESIALFAFLVAGSILG